MKTTARLLTVRQRSLVLLNYIEILLWKTAKLYPGECESA